MARRISGTRYLRELKVMFVSQPWLVAFAIAGFTSSLAPLGLLMAITVTWVACGPARREIDVVAEQAPPEQHQPDGVAYYGTVLGGKDLQLFRPFQAPPGDRPYAAVTWRGGEVISYEFRRPGGQVAMRVHTFVLPDGSRQLVSRDVYGTLLAVDTYTADDTARHWERSGVENYRGCTELALTYDERGIPVAETCLDAAGHTVIDETGCQVRRSTVNDDGDMTQFACFDDRGRPIADASGVHRFNVSYDDLGRATEVHYFDEGGDRVAGANFGCSGWLSEWDDRGRVVGGTCLDAGSLPTEIGGTHAAGYVDEYDDNDCLVGRQYVTITGSTTSMGDVAVHRYVVDENCAVEEESQLDADGWLTSPGPGMSARVEYVRDAQGQVERQQCWGDRGRERSCLFGERSYGSVLELDYDERGRLVESKAFSASGRAVRHARDYPHVMRWSYGDDGRVSEQTYADTRDRRARGLGVWALGYRYDALGAVVSERNLDRDGDLMRSPGVGCAEIRTRYDERHRLESIECLDADGDPAAAALSKGGIAWWDAARVVVERDDDGNTVGNVFFSRSGRELRTLDCTDEETVCYV